MQDDRGGQAEELAPSPSESDGVTESKQAEPLNNADALAAGESEKPKSGDVAGSSEESESNGDDATESAGEPTGERRRQSGTARLKAKNAALEAELHLLRNAASFDDLLAEEVGPPPKETDFKDYIEFQNATIAHQTHKLNVARELRQRKEQATAAANAARQETIEVFREQIDDARKRIPDFDQVLKAATVSPRSGHLKELITGSEKGADLAYYLAKNQRLVAELDGMPPMQAAREIGRLEATISRAAPKTETKAPAPVPALRGGASASKDPATMGAEEFRAWYKSREKARASK